MTVIGLCRVVMLPAMCVASSVAQAGEPDRGVPGRWAASRAEISRPLEYLMPTIRRRKARWAPLGKVVYPSYPLLPIRRSA